MISPGAATCWLAHNILKGALPDARTSTLSWATNTYPDAKSWDSWPIAPCRPGRYAANRPGSRAKRRSWLAAFPARRSIRAHHRYMGNYRRLQHRLRALSLGIGQQTPARIDQD